MAKKVFNDESLAILIDEIKNRVTNEDFLGHAHGTATSSLNGFMSSDDKAKLDGLESSYYTESEIDGKVSDLNIAIDGKANSVHVHTTDDITDLQTVLDTKVPTSRTINNKALTENITLSASDIGLGNVDNTSDADKPISTAQQTALDQKLSLTGGTVSEADFISSSSDFNHEDDKLTYITCLSEFTGSVINADSSTVNLTDSSINMNNSVLTMDDNSYVAGFLNVGDPDSDNGVIYINGGDAGEPEIGIIGCNYTSFAGLTAGENDTLKVNGEVVALLSDISLSTLGITATATELNYVDGVTSGIQTQLNGKANDFSIEIYNGTSGNPKPVKFATVNYSTCGSENGVAIKLSMVSGHGNGTSYAFLQDAIIRVGYTGNVEVDNFKYYGAAVTDDGVARQYGDIFWVIDTTNKIVDFYCLMGQYARLQMTPYKRVTYSTGGTINQPTSCTVYSSGTKVWGNNSDIALMSDLNSLATRLSALEASVITIHSGTVDPVSTIGNDGDIYVYTGS